MWLEREVYARETVASHGGASVNHIPGGRAASKVDMLLAGSRSIALALHDGLKTQDQLVVEPSA